MAPKSKVPGYKLGKTIKKSAGIKVKECVHLRTGQKVAIKTFSLKGFLNPKDLEKLKKIVQRELFLSQHLRHANVLSCYEVHMGKKRAYILMEWMEGLSLLDRIKERGDYLPEWEARRYFRQLIHGIAYCHKNLIVHRDIKPGNLLLDKTKQNLKIIDFGLSNFPNDELKLKTHAGTRPYQAPEITTHDILYGGVEVDIYSCGVTLYHLLFGAPNAETFRHSHFTIPKRFIEANPDASHLIERMTAYEPQDRITISEIKSHGWFRSGNQEFLNDPYFEQSIDNDILLQTLNMTNCDRENLIQCLIQGRCTEDTTTYKLLEKMRAEG